jgi:uncharacterized membrane protein YfhO
LKYTAKVSNDKVAVFSEIYYPAGWSASIDGKPADIFRTDFILRALVIPAGSHELEFNFSPLSVKKGAIYSRITSGLLVLLLIGTIVFEIRRCRKESKN